MDLPRAHWLRVAGVMFVLALTALIVMARRLPSLAYQDGALPANVAAYLRARHGLHVDPRSIVLPGSAHGSAGLGPREVFFLGARGPGQPRDLHFVHLVLSRRGIPVHSSPLFSLSRTKTADERELIFDGQRYLAYASSNGGTVSVITILDLAGLSPRAVSDLSAFQRLLQRLTNWQETGRWRGLDRIEVKLPLPSRVTLSWRRGLLQVTGRRGTWSALVHPGEARVVQGPLQASRLRIGKRTLLAWAVDTVRNFSFVGPERIAWLEDLFYGVVDRARRLSGSSVSAVEIKDEMSLPIVASSASGKIAGWPPPPLQPILRPPLKDEGRWVEVQGPFLRADPGRPSFFAMTFVRPDRERLFARVYFVAWDPRRLELHMVGGTAEPRSATGDHGEGIIPREPALLRRLVAGFNGGFQSVHGDFGMMVEGKVYCPPKPWAATVARLADGSTGFGTWDGKAAHGLVPEEIRSFRQNLTPLVEDGVFNPWRRGSWGGGAGFLTGSGPTAFIIRSGLCLHRSGHLMYVLGDPVDGPTLGQAMQRVGCTYAMELDINRGHVGFEFYNVLGQDEHAPREPSFREERYFSRRGAYPGVPALRYLMREVIRGTGNSPVPRYLGREARDFFFLVHRQLQPGADLAPLGKRPDEGRWTSAALPPAAVSFPPALQRTFLHPDRQDPERRVHLVQLDLRWLETTLCLPRPDAGCLPAPGETDGPLAILPLGRFGPGRALLGDGKTLAGMAGSGPSLSLRPRRDGGPSLPELREDPDQRPGSISFQGAAGEKATADADASRRGVVNGALCVTGAGTLLYAAGIGARATDLRASLERAGCTPALLLGHGAPLLLGKGGAFETVFGDVLPPVANSPSLVLRRSRAPWGSRIFTHVEVQPRSVWTAAQPERTRASLLRHAKKKAAELGLEPPKSLTDLCREPWSAAKELWQFRYRDPRTGKTCGPEPGRVKRPRDRRTIKASKATSTIDPDRPTKKDRRKKKARKKRDDVLDAASTPGRPPAADLPADAGDARVTPGGPGTAAKQPAKKQPAKKKKKRRRKRAPRPALPR